MNEKDSDDAHSLMIDSRKTLYQMMRINHNIFFVLCVAINIIICVDMYYSFKSPFSPAARRLRYYLVALLLSCGICFFNEPWLTDPKANYH